MEKAKELGYEIELHYVGADSVQIAKETNQIPLSPLVGYQEFVEKSTVLSVFMFGTFGLIVLLIDYTLRPFKGAFFYFQLLDRTSKNQ